MADPGTATPASLPVAPTLGLVEAARRAWDVIAVGAGPAGACAARELARAGRSVLLVDKSSFPRSKVCGSCLNGRVLSALEAVGLGALVEEAGGVVLDGLRLAVAGAEVTLTLPGGAALARDWGYCGGRRAACGPSPCTTAGTRKALVPGWCSPRTAWARDSCRARRR
jgi:hypothetical protein